MTSIRETFNKMFSGIADHEYRRGRDDGYAQAIKDFEAVLADFIADRPTRRDAPQQQLSAPAANSTKSPPRRRRRGLTPIEGRVLDFVAANPGCTMADLRTADIVSSPGTVYSLVARRKLARREDPKPHLGDRPWVHFHPMEPRNGQT